jgi:hypothetical protein
MRDRFGEIQDKAVVLYLEDNLYSGIPWKRLRKTTKIFNEDNRCSS